MKAVISMKCYADIAHRARALHAAGALPTRQWTLPLICDHLANAMTGSTGVLGPGPRQKPTPLPQRWVGRILVLTFGYIPSGVKSPERVLPRPHISWEEAIGKLQNAVALCEQKSQTVEPWLVHPLMGFSDAPTWQRFHLVHARHHFRCLKIP